jgi:hypothetical protein
MNSKAYQEKSTIESRNIHQKITRKIFQGFQENTK